VPSENTPPPPPVTVPNGVHNRRARLGQSLRAGDVVVDHVARPERRYEAGVLVLQ